MGRVAEIIIPPPPALEPAEDGVRTQGQAYLLHAPLVATEPMAVQAPTGETLLLAATELYYRDAAGEWDVLYGSAPVSVSAHGRQARYERPWPLGDDVFVAEPERVKHYAVLHRAPRPPGAHLGEGTEFGVAWLVSGTRLPAGRHDSIQVGPFTLPQPWAQDTAGERIYGYYEVVEAEDGLQQLYLWLPAEWLLSEERVYPVTVDPTVGTTTDPNPTHYHNQKKIGKFSNGTLIVIAGSDAYVSTDKGETWVPLSTPIDFTRASIYVCDEDDSVYVVTGSGGFWFGTPTNPERTAFSWTTGGNLSYGRRYHDVVGHPTDNGWVAHVVCTYESSDPYLRRTAEYYRVTIASDRTITTSSAVSLYTILDMEATMQPSIVMDAAHNLYVVWDFDGTVYLRSATAASGWSWDSTVTVGAAVWSFWAALDSQGRLVIGATRSHPDGGYTPVLWRRAASGAISELPSPGVRLSTAIGYLKMTIAIGQDDDIYLIYAENGLRAKRFDGSAWSAPVVWDATTTAQYPNARRTADSSAVDVIYRVGSSSPYTVRNYRLNLNQPPQEAGVVVASAAIDASVGVDITIQHNDPDGDQMGAWALRRRWGINTEWWSNSTKAWVANEVYNVGSGTSVTIPAADNAGKWQSGVIYQLAASTRDSSGETGPYTSTPVVLNVGAAPQVIVTGPTGTVRSGSANVTWTCDVATSAHRVRLLQGQTVVFDSGKLTGTNVRALTVTGLQDGQTYTPEVTVWDTTAGGGVPSQPTTGAAFSVSYTRPLPAMDVSAVGDAALAAVKLRWRRGWSRPGAFTRQSVAYLPDGTQVGAGQPRYYGGGIMVEEGTTNLLTENQSSVETDLSGVVGNYPDVTVARDTTASVHGSACVRVHAPSRFRGLRLTGINLTAGTTYTFSAYVKGAVGGESVKAALANGPWIMSSQTYTLTTEFQRITFTFTPDETNTYTLEIGSFDPDDVEMIFYADCLQLEAKPYATSWTLGGTTRAAETLTVPTSGVVEPQEGTIECWIYVTGDLRIGPRVWRVFHIEREGGGDGILLFRSSDGILLFRTVNEGGVTDAYVGDSALLDGWRYIAVTWSASEIKLFIDGVLQSSTKSPRLPSALHSIMSIGYRHTDNTRYANTLFDEFRISNRARSDEEIAAVYASGKPFVWDDHTLALHTWANTLEGGTQEAIFSHWGVERLESGAWRRIAEVANPDTGDWVEYTDYAVGSGRPYRYRVVAYGSNGTETKGEPVTASVVIPGGLWLHDSRDPASTAHWFQYHELPSSDRPVIPSGKFQFAGRKLPVVQMDASQMDRTLRYRIYLSDETDDRAALEALYERRTTLCLRNHRGKKYYVAFTEMPLDFERRGAWADVEFQVVDFKEEV